MSQPGYYDESYPPSLFEPPTPPPVPATGATAGTPGTWTPAGCVVPADVNAVTAAGIVASPSTPWQPGQYVQTATPLVAGRCYWLGSAWAAGVAP